MLLSDLLLLRRKSSNFLLANLDLRLDALTDLLAALELRMQSREYFGLCFGWRGGSGGDLGVCLGFRDWKLVSVPGIEVVERFPGWIDDDDAPSRRSGLQLWVADLDEMVEQAKFWTGYAL